MTDRGIKLHYATSEAARMLELRKRTANGAWTNAASLPYESALLWPSKERGLIKMHQDNRLGILRVALTVKGERELERLELLTIEKVRTRGYVAGQRVLGGDMLPDERLYAECAGWLEPVQSSEGSICWHYTVTEKGRDACLQP